MAESRPTPRKRPSEHGGAWVLAVVTALLAAGAWFWFDANFERQTRTVEVEQSPEARRNPFLAAERFLQRLGVDARSSAGIELLRSPPASGDMLIVDGLPPLSAARRQQLLDWLIGGGEMLVEAMDVLEPDDEPGTDDLLAEFGAVLRMDDSAPAEVVAEIDADGVAEPVRAGFLGRYYLEDAYGESIGAIGADDRPRLLQYAVGDGLLFVVSDTRWLSNSGIGDHDNALLLDWVAAERDTVWLLHDVAVPPLALLIWHAAPAAVIASALLIVALLWGQGGRLGPLLPAPPDRRRDLLEHLRAAGEFLWRLGRGGLALQQTRRRVERGWLRRHPPLRALDEAARAERIALLCRLPMTDVRRALYAPIGDDRVRDHLGLIRISETLRRLSRRT